MAETAAVLRPPATAALRLAAREERIGAMRRMVELHRTAAPPRPVVSLKTLYSDFEVRERPAFYGDGAPLTLELADDAAGTNGTVASSVVKRPRDAHDGAEVTGAAPVPTSGSGAAHSVAEVVGALVSAEDLARLLAGLAAEAPSIPLPSVADKEKRAELHKAIKACLGGTHVSNTVDGVLTVLKASAADRREERRRSRVSRPPPKYHHFTLYKENVDSNQAMRMLAQHLRLSSRQLQFCGTKDKRAVTLQRVAVRETTVERLKTVNSRSFGAHNVLKVCGFAEAEHGLRLGDALGNHFRIALRVFPAGQLCDVDGAAASWPALSVAHLQAVERVVREAGVINYFGPQRFGTTDVLTSDVGVLFLQGRLRDGLRLTLVSKSSIVPEMRCVVDLFDRNDYAGALQATPYYCYQERDILKHLSANPNDYLGALQAIARTMAMMYFHAAQSLIWNRIASARLSGAGRARAEVGDLVLETTYQARLTGVEAPPPTAAAAADADVKLPPVRRLASEDDCARFGLEDVLLPVPGPDRDLVYPCSAGCTQDDYAVVLAELGVDFGAREALSLMKVFHFHGTYRALGVRPTDFTLRLETVATWRTPVLRSDWERHCEQVGIAVPAPSTAESAAPPSEPAGPVQVVVAAFALPPGSYATSVLREFCIATTETLHGNDTATNDE
ncbi:tRNA pseudouridine synthase TruD [Novymonas esmeraldas]|uniref:tRNA pseudouridine synthase TruD n=1 Tax=Novymonas esmeraldas TaxID=1808958 RepID=A0AAW0EK09_9TRYP